MAKRLNDTTTRDRTLLLIAGGEITQAEAARLAGVSRQTVMRWCKIAGTDADQARERWINKRWREVRAKARLAARQRASSAGKD